MIGAQAPATSVSATDTLAEFASATRWSTLPTAVRVEAKRLFIDVVGNIVGGRTNALGEIALAYVRRAGTGGPSPILATDLRTSIPLAGYAHGRLGDALDAADTFLSVYHIGNPTVSSALTLAEAERSSGQDMLTAIAVGMEIGTRIAASVGPPSPMHRIHPERPHVRGGRMPALELATAAAASKILQLDPQRIEYTLGIAAANASLNATRWGERIPLPTLKYADNGGSTEVGIVAALQAAVGQTSHPSVLDGDRGLWRVRGAQSCDFELMTKDLGTKWLFLDNTYKPWPGCRWTHYSLTLLERMFAEGDLTAEDVDDIQHIEVRSHVWGMAPYFSTQDPVGVASCEMNYPHAVAMFLLGVPVGPAWYSPATLADPRVAAIRRKVTVSLDERSLDLESWYVDGQIRRLPNSIRVTLRRRQVERAGDHAKGDPWDADTRFTDEGIAAKFRSMLATSSCDQEDVMRKEQMVMSVDTFASAKTIFETIGTAG